MCVCLCKSCSYFHNIKFWINIKLNKIYVFFCISQFCLIQKQFLFEYDINLCLQSIWLLSKSINRIMYFKTNKYSVMGKCSFYFRRKLQSLRKRILILRKHFNYFARYENMHHIILMIISSFLSMLNHRKFMQHKIYFGKKLHFRLRMWFHGLQRKSILIYRVLCN